MIVVVDFIGGLVDYFFLVIGIVQYVVGVFIYYFYQCGIGYFVGVGIVVGGFDVEDFLLCIVIGGMQFVDFCEEMFFFGIGDGCFYLFLQLVDFG